jgi:hypothetical protein
LRNAVIAVLVTLAVAAGFEALLRFTLPYEVDYYALRSEPGVYDVPYGRVVINSGGFPDEEFDLGDPRPRVGYFGDSVVWGTGAGQDHRLSDLLEKARPEAQHLTLASTPRGMQDVSVLLKLVDRFSLDVVVYVMNLNDVMPAAPADPGAAPARATPVQAIVRFARQRLDVLRGNSYLYNLSRSRIREVLRRRGVVETGMQAFELYPKGNEAVVKQTADAVRAAAGELRARGVRFCVLLLPYEMQISDDAARRYQDLGIGWEDGFLERTTQAEILEDLDGEVEILDAYGAFAEPNAPPRTEIRAGDYFVFNRGDKIDYNHPNRAGHERIAEYVLQRRFCETAPGARPTRAASAGGAVR